MRVDVSQSCVDLCHNKYTLIRGTNFSSALCFGHIHIFNEVNTKKKKKPQLLSASVSISHYRIIRTFWEKKKKSTEETALQFCMFWCEMKVERKYQIQNEMN